MFINLKINNKLLLKKIIIIIYLLFYNTNILSYFNIFFVNILYQYEIKEIEHYLKICEDLKNIKKFEKLYYPKISIISAVYNRERFLLRFLSSIQYQNFNNIEIILIDDCSIDNSVNIINEFKKEDERIILIKNKKNKGTFIARNLGALYAKGKYVILPDPDDIISKNILLFCYNYAEKYKYEVIRFTSYLGNQKTSYNKQIEKLGNKPVYQPELSSYIFYGYSELVMVDYSINNKFIKKEVYIKTLNALSDYFLNIYMIYMEDQVLNYILHRTAKSFYFSKKIGFFYLQNAISITKNVHKISLLMTKFIFIYLKLLYEYTKNKKYEKDMANILLNNLCRGFNIIPNLQKSESKEDIIFYYNIVNSYLKNEYTTNENKYILNDFNSIIEKKLKNFN